MIMDYGTLERIHHALYEQCREQAQREASPTAGINLVDTSSRLLHAIVHPSDIQARDGGVLVMATLFGIFPLKTPFADGGYQGPQFKKAIAKVLPHLDAEIVKRSDRVRGFVILLNVGSSSAPSLGSIAAEGSQRIA